LSPVHDANVYVGDFLAIFPKLIAAQKGILMRRAFPKTGYLID